MPLKSFERTILFTYFGGRSYPIVEVIFVKPNGKRQLLPLLFDTGASCIIVRPQYHFVFPKSTSTEPVGTAGKRQASSAQVTTGRMEFLGKAMNVKVLLLPMKSSPLWAGLFGRECFDQFGFGYWQSSGELHVTLTP